MLNSIEQLFYEPIKELNNFLILKENITYEDFIDLYVKSSSSEEKINLLKSLIDIFSHEKALLNICYFCLKNNKLTEIELELEDNDDKSNINFLLPQENFQSWLIEQFFSEKNEQIKLNLKEIFIIVSSVFGINKYYLSEIYEQLTKIYFYSEEQDNININNLFVNLKFLACSYGLNINNDISKNIKVKGDDKNKNEKMDMNYIYNNKPYNFYFFKGKESIKINPTLSSNEKSKINDGITIFTCFRCILNPIYCNKDKVGNKNMIANIHSTIFNIIFNNGNKLLLKIDGKMNLILVLLDNKNTSYNNSGLILGKIDENKWYNISISLNTIKKNKKFPINIIINNTPNTQIKEIECENVKINEINNIILYNNFAGFATDFIVFNKLVDKDITNLYHYKFKYGLYKYNHVTKFIEQIKNNILENLIILLIPNNNNGNNEIENLSNTYESSNRLINNFDIKYFSLISDKVNIINVIINNRYDKKISLLGGIENILPFIEILTKISKDDIGNELNLFQNCLLVILSIINSILINKNANLESISKSNFFEILSTFLQNLSITTFTKDIKEIFNDEIMNTIINLANYLFNIEKNEIFDKICIKSFLNNFLFNIKIINKFSLKNQNLIFDFISNNITKINTEEILLFNIDNLLFILQYYNENYREFFCCDYHQNFYGENNKKIIDLKNIFNSVTQIIGKISNFNEDIYIKILHFLLIWNKPCLIKYIIKNIFLENLAKVNKNKKEVNKNEKNKFVKYLVKNDLLNTLLFLLSTYVYPDVTNEIINVFSYISLQIKSMDSNNVISNTNDFFNKENNINYISSSIFPIYIRIKPIEHKEENNDKTKKIDQSEIIFNDNNKNIKKKNNIDNKYIDDLPDDYNDDFLGPSDIKRFINSEKGKNKYRKLSGDASNLKRLFNLEKISTVDYGFKDEDNDIKIKKKLNLEDNSDFNKIDEDDNFDNINPNKVIRSPRKLNSVHESVINFARIGDKKIKTLVQKPSIDSIYESSLEEYKKMEPILDRLNEEKINSYKKIILEALINWLKIDFSNYVLKIISGFLNKYKIEYIYIYDFIEILSSIINEQIYTRKYNLSTELFNLDFYFWYIDCMFQFYLVHNDKKDLIFSNNIIIFPEKKDEKIKEIISNTLIKGQKILINIIISLKIDKSELVKLFNILLLCGTRIKKYYALNQNTVIYLNCFYSEFFTNILKEYNKYYSSANSGQLLPIINICYEYILYFNNENKSEDINNFIINDNQIFSGIILSGINTSQVDNNNMTNFPISKFWTDYQLFRTIMNVLKQIINIDNIDYKDDKYLEENILSHKKSDMFLDQITFLCNCQTQNQTKNNNINNNNNNNLNNNNTNNNNKPIILKEDIKDGEMPLIYIISNLYVVILNLVNKKEEKEEIINEYKKYIIFLILSSSNISSNSPMLTTIQTKVELIINYFIGFIIERYNNGIDKDLLIPCLNEVFILMIKIVKRTYDQITNRRGTKLFINKIISYTTTQKKIDFSKCAVFKIFSKENMSNVFNKEFVFTMKKNNFKFFDDKAYLIKLLLSCVDLKSIKKEIKNIFFASKYLKKGHERINKINEMKIEDWKLDPKEKNNKDYEYDIQFFKMRRKISSIMENNLSALEEEIKLFKEKSYLNKEKTKLFYKKIKKKIFSFSGLWSYKDIFYQNDFDYNDDNDGIIENELSSENSMDEIINKQKNKYQNRHIVKYKLSNHYGKIPLRPILTPIYDINAYLPVFSLFKKENLFIENEPGKDITSIMNLNMNEIFNEEENTMFELYENMNDEEDCDTVISNIFKEIFPNIYNNYKSKVYPNLSSDKLKNPPLSGFILNSQLCCYVVQMSHIKGYLYLGKNFCSFIQNIYDENNNNDNKNRKKNKEKDEDLDEEKKLCFGSYLKLNESKYVFFKIKYSSIQFIFLRKYYYKDSALEIFTSKNKVYYLNFPNSFKRQNALNLLLNKFSNKKEIKLSKNKIIGYNVSVSDNSYINFNSNNPSSDFITNLTENWLDWNISTMELLLWLNILSNRSFNDISQYPVFPWILTQYEDKFTPTKDSSLSKSYMPDIFSSEKKNIIKGKDPIKKSNSGETKTKSKGSFLKAFGKKKSSGDEIKGENTNINNINNNPNFDIIEKKIGNDQFIIKEKKSQIKFDKDIRNFSLPMGMMTLNEAGENRKNNYISKYTMTKKEIISANQKENKNQQNTALIPQLYIYGSHYSNPLYVCHYLTRVFPYTNIGIELQGDKFDDPNRMLISVNKSFEGSTSHEGDLRELCPEFFYLPEMFVNRNNLDLKIKTKKNKDKTNDVTLPNWANNNNYIFITKLKTYLESEEVNKNINKWFDLIFGYKQKGKEAEAAFNLFIPSSYDNFDIEKEATSPDQKIYYLRLTEFGLTPHQITNKKFGKRKQKENKKKTISESWREKEPRINAIKNKKSDNNKNIFKILKLKFIDDENFLGVLSNYQFIKNEIFNFQNENEHNFNFDSNAKYYIKKEIIPKLNFLRVKNNEIINKEYPIIIYSKGEYIAEGGYYDGRIIITQLNLKIKSKDMNKAIVQTFEVINKMDTSPVIVLLITKDEKYIFSGSMLGSIVIYKNEKNNWKKKHQINDHLNIPITSIYHHDILNLWGSAGYDGYVNIYTFPSNKKISSIKVQQSALCADYIFISSSPLPCFIIYSSHDFTFYTYSLIGKLICKVCENDTNIYSPKILKESNFGEVLVYGNNRGQINMRFLPSLDLFLNRDINPGEDIISYINVDLIDISNNGWYCIAWNNDNGMFYTIYDSSHISQKEELMIIYLANDLDE